MTDISRRFEHDRCEVESLQGEVVVALDLGLGDPHNGGQQVARLHLGSGQRVMYKPRPMEVEADFFLAATSRGLAIDDLPWVVPRRSYGWMQHLDARPTSTPAQYFYNTGRMLRLLQRFGIYDLHCDNLIARETALVPIDLECAYGLDSSFTVAGPGRSHPLLQSSPQRCGLLPGAFATLASFAVDRSGLTAAGAEDNAGNRIHWRGLGSDSISWSWHPESASRADNLAREASGRVHAIDLAQLLAGHRYEDAHWAETGSTDPVRSRVARVLLRSTAEYVRLTDALRSPRLLGRPTPIDIAVAALRPLDDHVRARLGSSVADRVEAYERSTLLDLDVPVFYVDGTALWLGDTSVIPEVLTVSGPRHMGEVQAQRTSAVVELDQSIIRLSFDRYSGSRPDLVEAPDVTYPVDYQQAPKPSEDTDPTEAAVRVGELMTERAVEWNGTWSWFDVEHGPSGGPEPCLGTDDLYRGSAGISLFFAMLYQATNDSSWRKWAERASPGLLPLGGSDVSLATGTVGRAWASVARARLCARSIDQGELENCLTAALDRPIEPDDPLGVLRGWSGILAAVGAIADRLESEPLVDTLKLLTPQYLDALVHQRANPAGLQLQSSIRFDGGAAGIVNALALARRVASTDRLEDHLDLAGCDLQRAIDRHLEPRGGQWQARSGQAWCRGLAGGLLALGRVSSPQGLAAAANRLESSPHGDDIGLCCGLAGRLIVASTVASWTGDARAEAAAGELAQQACDRVTAWPVGTGALGLFGGLSGLGVSLLAHDRAGHLPCPLSLDLGGAPRSTALIDRASEDAS